MSWGALYFYYHCPKCEKKFKYAEDLISDFGNEFGKCPYCETMGIYDKDGPIKEDDLEYFEVE